MQKLKQYTRQPTTVADEMGPLIRFTCVSRVVFKVKVETDNRVARRLPGLGAAGGLGDIKAPPCALYLVKCYEP